MRATPSDSAIGPMIVQFSWGLLNRFLIKYCAILMNYLVDIRIKTIDRVRRKLMSGFYTDLNYACTNIMSYKQSNFMLYLYLFHVTIRTKLICFLFFFLCLRSFC